MPRKTNSKKISSGYLVKRIRKTPVDISKLPLDVVATVMAMMELGSDIQSNSIKPVKEFFEGLLPFVDEELLDIVYLLEKAIDHNAVIVDVNNSQLDSFMDDGEQYLLFKVSYVPNITWGDNLPIELVRDPSKSSSHIHEFFMKGFWNEDWSEELLVLWNRIAVAECLQYADNRAEYYGFQKGILKLGEQCKTLLLNFSVSQVHSMISTAYHNAAAFINTAGCTSYRHALNTIPGKIVSLASNPIKVKEWDRINQLPQTELSITLFNKLLGMDGDIGFYKCPATSYAAIAKEKLDNFNKQRGQLHTEKITSYELAQVIARKIDVLHYLSTEKGLNAESAMMLIAEVKVCLDIWYDVSVIPISSVPEIISQLTALKNTFDEQGLDFNPIESYYMNENNNV